MWLFDTICNAPLSYIIYIKYKATSRARGPWYNTLHSDVGQNILMSFLYVIKQMFWGGGY